MADSVEYKVLVCHTADLELAVRENLTSLGARLVSAEIITRDQYREIRNTQRSVNERGADLVDYVQNKVQRNPRHYHAFIGALKSDMSQYGDILTKLEQARLPQALEMQVLNPQLSPQREDDNPLPAQETPMTDNDAKESEETTMTDNDAKESEETTMTDYDAKKSEETDNDAKESKETTTTDCDAKESEGDIRFCCPCGKCSLETYLQDDCPESCIPYLGMTTLSQGDKENLNYILKKDTKRIMDSFADLSNATCDSIKRQGIKIDHLVRVAVTSNSSLRDKLIESTSVDRVFTDLAPEMSFFNHEILKNIIDVLGDKDDKDRLAEYSKQFKEFCKRKVFEVEPGPCTCGQRLSQLKGRTPFAIVLPTGEETLHNLEDAVSIKETLADDLDVPLDTLHLHRIDRGCIILVFSVPDSIAEELFPLPKEKLASLRVKGMVLFVPQDPKSESNLVEYTTACSADMHEPSSEHTPTISSGTPGDLLVSHSLPTSAQLSWTPAPDDETTTGYTVQVEGPDSTQEIPMDENATSYEVSDFSAITEAGTESPLSVSSTMPPNVQRIEGLKTKFHELLQMLISEVTIKQLPVDEFYQALTMLPLAFKREYERSIQQMLPAAKEIDGQRVVTSSVFLPFSPLFVFIDYDLLNHMIVKFGSAELKSEMALYIEEVKIFTKETTVGDLIDRWPGCELESNLNYAQLNAKFRDDPMTYTLQRLNRFRRRFCIQVRLSKLIFCLISVESTTSFFATWIIPAAIIPELSEAIQRLHESVFEEEHIISIFVNQKQIYPFTGEILPSQQLSIAAAACKISHDAEKKVKFDDAPYDVEPGLCVIINNMDFAQGASLLGENEEEEKLLVLFTALGFDVKIHRNLTGKEILDTVQSYGVRQHSGAFFLVILSHGTSINHRPAVLGTDGTPVVVNDLESFFYASKCKSLNGKPKIFLIDACRSSQEEKTFNPASTSGMITKESSTSLSHLERVEIRSDSVDFLIVYAATDGHVAFATDKGSYLTQAFVKVTSKADETDSLQEIIRKVKVEVHDQDRTAHQTVESIDRLTHKYLIKSNTTMLTIQELQAKFDTQVQQWIPVRDATIEEIEKTIEKLKEHHRNVNIFRITGSSVSIAGSLIAIVGFGLAPVTLGASLGLSVSGIALAVVGGGTAAGASIADTFLQKSNIKHVQDQLAYDYQQLDAISQTAKEIEKVIDGTRQKCPGMSTREFAAVFGEVFTQGIARTTNVAVKLAELGVYSTLEIGAFALRVGGAAARGIAAAGIVLNVILIPIDIAEIIRSSFSLAKGSQTKAIKQLTDTVKQLKKQKAAIEDLLEV